MNRKLLQQALDALKLCSNPLGHTSMKVERAIAALEAELAKPEQFTLICPKCGADRTKEDCKGERLQCGVMGQAQVANPEQEPVGVVKQNSSGQIFIDGPNSNYFDISDFIGKKLYTAPPRKEWVGLTDDERANCWNVSAKQSALNIEAKIRSKNEL